MTFIRFKFTQEDIAPYVDKKPPFGVLGSPTYTRTYSRTVDDGSGGSKKETYLDTIIRVIEGNMNLGIANNDPTATREWATEALDHMFNMSVLPPGRGFWMLGTEYAEKRGGDALNNCWFIATRPQSYENIEMFEDQEYIFSDPVQPMPSYPFVFMFDRAMLGGGVGFGVGKENIDKIPKVKSKVNLKIFVHPTHPDWNRIFESEEWDRIKEYVTYDDTKVDHSNPYYFATDDREGWNISVRETIDSHFTGDGENDLTIDLSRIRQYGTKIEGFGGTASGPLPLIIALTDINNILNFRANGYLTSSDGLDMMNLLGRCVVAGNVRRTALIALGDPTDKEYVKAKNFMEVDPIMEKGEDGYSIWEANKFGRVVQRRKDPKIAMQDRYTEILKEEGLQEPILGIQRNSLITRATEETEELYRIAFKQENHRWASNNSVLTDEMFDDHHFIAAGIIANGEPGVVNLWLSKNYGRIKDGFQKGIDEDTEGTNPCGEISLGNAEPCNLVEFVPYMADKAGLDHGRALAIATQYTYRITFAKYMWKSTQRVIEKNRRIGVSLTGVQDYFLSKYGHYAVKGYEEDDMSKPIFHQKIVDELDSWYNIVKDTNVSHAKDIGSVPSIKLTTNKPSGTVAKLPGVSSGIHWHYSPFMIQRIRFHDTDPGLPVLEACGFDIEKSMKEPNTMVVSFPTKNPNADHPQFRSSEDVSLEEQFANQYLFAFAWADNAVSATLSFKHDEVDKIEPLLKAYNNKVKSTSLLPYSGHGYTQPPWEPITEDVYNEMLSKVKHAPEDLYHLYDMTLVVEDDMLDDECVGGMCPIR